MKRLLILIFAGTVILSLDSCSLFKRQANCPAYDNLHTETDRNGQYKKSKTKSNLFPKKMR